MAVSTPYGQAKQPDLRPPRWRRVALVVVGVVLALTLLALAVGSLGGDSGSGESADAGSAGDASASGVDDGSAVRTSGDGPLEERAPGAGVALEPRAVIRTGALTLTDPDVADARREVIAAVTALGGYVADEASEADDDGDLRLTDLTVQVPTDQFDVAMERFGAAGTVTGRTQSARDVTEEVVDVDSRVASAEASLRRIRILLGRAVSLGEVIRLEQVLSSRQADLESLLGQQQSLAARTDLAVVQVAISAPAQDARVVAEDAAGFLAGLSRGWDALASGYVALATLLGIMAPTLVVLGALALVARWAVRRFRHPQSPADAVV